MLKLPAIYSQRDNRWASILLGYNTSTYTIGSHGCLITCLSMLTNRTPDTTNQILQSSGGFVSGGGLFIWNACANLGLKQTYLSPKWDGPVTDFGVTKAKELIDAGNPLLCEVDFNPSTIGEDMHFVLVIGYEGENFTMADPWTGTTGSMDVYGGFRRAVIQYRAYDKTFQNSSVTTSVAVESQTFENLVRKSTIYDWIISTLKLTDSETVVKAEIPKFLTYEDKIRQQEAQLSADRENASALEVSLKEKTTELQDIKAQVAEMQKTIENTLDENQRLLRAVQDLKAASQVTQYTGWKKRLFDFIAAL
jgi:hypothetical protein